MKYIYALFLALAIVGAGLSAFCLKPSNTDVVNVIVAVVMASFVGFMAWFANLLGEEVSHG